MAGELAGACKAGQARKQAWQASVADPAAHAALHCSSQFFARRKRAIAS